MARGRADEVPAQALLTVHTIVFAAVAIVVAIALVVYFAV
jgi:hypothetical protein